MRSLLILPVAVGAALASVPVAGAQEFVAPRFGALEQQQQAVEQTRLDALEQQRQTLRNQGLLPGSGVSPATSALRQLDIGRDMDRIRLEGQQQRALTAREREIADAGLPNRRISRASVLVVSDPVRYALPAAPAGQYYARLEGRFVLVDAMSELVVTVVEPTPSDPTADLPPGPLPPPQPPIPRAHN